MTNVPPPNSRIVLLLQEATTLTVLLLPRILHRIAFSHGPASADKKALIFFFSFPPTCAQTKVYALGTKLITWKQNIP